MARTELVYGGFLGVLPTSADYNQTFYIKDDSYGGPKSGTMKAADLEFARANLAGLNLVVDYSNSEWDKYQIISSTAKTSDGAVLTPTSVGSAGLVASGPGDLDGLQQDIPNPPLINNRNDWQHDNFEYNFNYGSKAWQDLAIGKSITVSYTVKAWEYDYPIWGITEADDIKITMTFVKTCFTAASMIRMADGTQKRADQIRVGDLVATADRGAQPVRWVGQTAVAGVEFTHFPSWRPVRIAAGALGNGLPVADLEVSQLHRIVVRGDVAQRLCGTDEVLLAARFLTALEGVEIVEGDERVDYVHFMFDQHEILFSNGLRSESFCVSPLSRTQVGSEQLAELEVLFPELAARVRDGAHDLARTVARGHLAERVVAGHRDAGIALQ